MEMKYKAIIVSDLHLGTKDSKAKEFIEFLDTHPTDLLILNGDIIDGFQALCSCTHENRNILLTYWVAKMVKRALRKDENPDAPVLGSAKATYLTSIQI